MKPITNTTNLIKNRIYYNSNFEKYCLYRGHSSSDLFGVISNKYIFTANLNSNNIRPTSTHYFTPDYCLEHLKELNEKELKLIKIQEIN